MNPPKIPPDEASRLKSLHAYQLLDTAFEAAFDDLTKLASEICGTPIALVSLIDKDRQWFKSKVGLAADETPREVSFCGHAILGDDIFVIQDACADPRFADNPLVVGDPGIRFYAGTPLRGREGMNLGTLCVIDRKPRDLSPLQRTALTTLKRQVEAQFELRRSMTELAATQIALERVQRQKASLTAMVVHDLKNPLASIIPNAKYVADQPELSEESKDAVQDIERAASILHQRVLNLLDVSSSEDGALVVTRKTLPLGPFLQSVVDSIARRAAEKEQELFVVEPDTSLNCSADPELLRRTLENLIINALKYSPPKATIRLDATQPESGWVEIRVADDGPGIAETNRDRIFDKYTRLDRDVTGGEAGSRGLGLAFCKAAAEAHDGSIRVERNVPRGAVFVVRLPSFVTRHEGRG